LYLVLNLGLKSIRAIVFDDSGQIITNKALPLTTILNGALVEQSGHEWWDKGIEVINQALENKKIVRQVEYITVTASSCCVVGVDSNGYPLHNIIMVSDKRAKIECDQISALPSYKALKEKRSDFEVKSSLMLPKILWIKNNAPEVFDDATLFLSPNEYFGYRLCGKAIVDNLNAEKCFYDSETQTYPQNLLADLEIPVAKLPDVAEVGTIAGELTNEFKALINVDTNQSIKLMVSTYDAICAFYGSGAATEGDTCDVSGTVTSLRTLTKGKKKLDTTTIFSQYQPEFDISIIGGSNNLGGGLIEWAKQAFYSESTSPYELMESEAKEINCGADGILFLPYLMGERSPLWNDDARAVFFGLSRNHNRKHMIRAVFESTGFALKSLLDEIELTGQKVEAVKFSGGLSRIHLIAQIKADILGKEIHIVEEYETTALGAFLLMGIASGIFANLCEASKVVRIREIILPNPKKHQIYLQAFALYKELYGSLLNCYEMHSQLHKQEVYSPSEKIENM
jgi:sugar (pentulose or hexulose) kinase